MDPLPGPSSVSSSSSCSSFSCVSSITSITPAAEQREELLHWHADNTPLYIHDEWITCLIVKKVETTGVCLLGSYYFINIMSVISQYTVCYLTSGGSYTDSWLCFTFSLNSAGQFSISCYFLTLTFYHSVNFFELFECVFVLVDETNLLG